MMCNHCGHHEATIHYMAKINGVATEHYLCRKCAREMAAEHHSIFSPIWRMLAGGAQPDPAAFSDPPTTQLPPDIGGEFCRRRRRNELRVRLNKAVEQEDYETATRLRDEIRELEKNT